MSHSKSGLYLFDEQAVGGLVPSLYNGLPVELLHRIGDDPSKGDGGILYNFEHFHNFLGPLAEGAAGGWTLSGVTGAATIVLPNSRIGEAELTSDGTANCDPTLQFGAATGPANFIYAVGKRLWFAIRCKWQTVASMETLIGLCTPDTEPTVTNTFPSDGIFFHKTAAATKLSFDARKDGTSTSKATITGTLVDDTYTTLGFHVNELGHILPFQDGALLASGVIPAGTANIPVAGDVMQPHVAFRVASKKLTIDWLLTAQDI